MAKIQKALRAIVSDKQLLFGLIGIAVLLLIILFQGVLETHDPYDYGPDSLAAPGINGHLLGTNKLGQDVYSMLIAGVSTSLKVALISSLISALLGILLGGAAGFLGGKVDMVLSELINVFMAMGMLRILPENSIEMTGSALFMGKDLISISHEEMNRLRWKEIAVVFQKAMNALSPVHRIGTQIEDIYRVHEPRATKAEIHDRTMELLRMVNMPERVYRLYPHEMSGGMLQRVAIVISLLHSPKLLVFDEATTALDVVTQGQILEEVVAMEKTIEMTRIMITHDMSVVASSCRKVAVMYAGELVEIGMVRDVLKQPLHPYTQGLMSSFPSLKGEKKQLRAIPGFLPDLSDPPAGCAFASRCPHCTQQCLSQKPVLREMPDGRRVACHLVGGQKHE